MEIDELKEELRAAEQAWKDAKPEYTAEANKKIGNFLRGLQNKGWTITALAELWGVKSRQIIYNFLALADVPHNGKQKRKMGPLMPIEWYLEYDPETRTAKTVRPVPPHVWPKDMPERIKPTQPWEGYATWDEDHMLVNRDGAPLHYCLKNGTGITELIAKASQ